jgi:murein DD-endopeptidase MepM/ murein hydrolase activator NlpD
MGETVVAIRTSRQGRALHRWALALALCFGLAAAAPAAELDLEGTWYVLVHYQDAHAPNPQQERWEDKVWVFERKGSRIHWTEYPIVVFDDEAGRFERRSTGQYARILHYWEPTAAQRADIDNGLQVNTRGSKKKKLRGNDSKGWSSGRSTGAASASVVTYQEVWTIDGMPAAPVFARSDFMGGSRTDSMEGRTEYAATEVKGNREISGRYNRDGHRQGRFRMWRSAPTGALKGKKTQAELQRQGFARTLESSPELRAQASETIELELRKAGLSLADAEIEILTTEAITWRTQGVPEKQVVERLGKRAQELAFGFAPAGAIHDDSARYVWPFASPAAQPLLLGPDGMPPEGVRRPKSLKDAYWFGMQPGTPVHAARAGVVQRIVDGFPEGGPERSMATKSNLVVVVHDDGTYAIYGQLQRGIELEQGKRVEAGDRLALSGRSGQVAQPSLLFAVQRIDEDGGTHSVPIVFDAASDALVTGKRYGGTASE